MSFIKLIQSFGYAGFSELFSSLQPSLKYEGLPFLAITFSVFSELVLRVFGLDAFAFVTLFLVLLLELFSGLKRAHVEKEEITSTKFSRFSFKLAYYLLLIAASWLMSVSFAEREKYLPAQVFDYLHIYVTIHIVVENFISIGENVAIINGKPKSHWIDKLQKKVSKIFE